jgi:hypothetical protein
MNSPGARRGEQLFGEDRRDNPAPLFSVGLTNNRKASEVA